VENIQREQKEKSFLRTGGKTSEKMEAGIR
jgi:hypothetical protein